METKISTWRPNHSGTFSNRVNVHDVEDDKIFVIEFHDKITESSERIEIVKKICAAPELYEALEVLLHAYKGDASEDFYNKDAEQIAIKALSKATL